MSELNVSDHLSMALGQKKIIIVNGLNRSGLAVASALKSAGDFSLHFVSSRLGTRGTFKKLINSNCIDSIDIVEGNYADNSVSEFFIKIVAKHNADIILPMGSSAISISILKPRLEKYCKVLVDDYERLIIFHDKSKTYQIANELGIPYPKTKLPTNIKEIKALSSKIKYPVVLKARKGSGADGVWYARDASELIEKYLMVTDPHEYGDGLVRDSSQPMVQEYIPGELHDVTAFCVNGQIKLGLTQKRLMTKPLTGGMGVVNVTTKNEQLLNYASKLVERVKWNGVLLVDFKIDSRNGQPKLLEVNPRFWGTTWLTIKSGLNYPYYLVLNAYGLPINYPNEYKVGLHCRWPMSELSTIFEKPLNIEIILRRIYGFFSRFRMKNCVYYFRP